MQLDPDKKLEEQIKTYAELAKENKNIDVSTLMMNALQTEEQNRLTKKEKRIAYFVSLAFAPFGLIFAVKFYFSNKSDAKQAALICLLLTIFTVVMVYIFFNVLLSSAGITNVQQLQAQPAQLQQLLQ